MLQRFSTLFLVLAVSLVTFVVSGPARAGIIVTVGKPAPEDASKRTKPGANLPAPDTRSTAATAPAPCPGEAPDKASASTCSQKIDPVTGLPADWKCVPIGGGLLYCEGPGAGAGADEGGAGGWDPDAEDDYVDLDEESWDAADEELQVLGCAGGNAAGGILGMASAIAALLVMVRARRR